jgi:hypothetical protein
MNKTIKIPDEAVTPLKLKAVKVKKSFTKYLSDELLKLSKIKD